MLAAVPGPGPAAAQPAQPESRARQSVAPAILIPPPGVTQELVLKDGTRAYGRVERIDGSSVVFRTATGGTLEIDAAQIVSLKPVEGRVITGSFLAADPNPTRLFFGPTARSLPRGGGYVAVYEVVVSGVQVGITDRISFGAGTPLVFGGGSEHPVWITPKIQVLNAGTTQGAIGIMHFLNVGGGNLGVAYGVVTHGTRDSAVTLGAGYAYDHTSSRVDGAAVGMVGAEHRVSRRVKLVTENYAFQGGGIGSFGVRFFGDRLSADLALVVPLGMGESVAFPMVNFVYRFGR
jgi:hypothetical protein